MAAFIVYDEAGEIKAVYRVSMPEEDVGPTAALNTPEGHSWMRVEDHHPSVGNPKSWRVRDGRLSEGQ